MSWAIYTVDRKMLFRPSKNNEWNKKLVLYKSVSYPNLRVNTLRVRLCLTSAHSTLQMVCFTKACWAKWEKEDSIKLLLRAWLNALIFFSKFRFLALKSKIKFRKPYTSIYKIQNNLTNTCTHTKYVILGVSLLKWDVSIFKTD